MPVKADKTVKTIIVIILHRDGRYPADTPKHPQTIEMTPLHISSDIRTKGFAYPTLNLSKYTGAYSLSMCCLQNKTIAGKTIFKMPKAT